MVDGQLIFWLSGFVVFVVLIGGSVTRFVLGCILLELAVAKKILGSSEILDLVKQKICKSQDLIEMGLFPRLAVPAWHEVDEDGRNWNISFVGNAFGGLNEVVAIINSVRDEVDIKQP